MTCTLQAAIANAQAADDAWSVELRNQFGKRAGDIRYIGRGRGEPGSELNRLYQLYETARVIADHEWAMYHQGTTAMTQDQPKVYGVSYGNGNDGVSHMFADFYVRTDDPWRLARLAILSAFKPEGFEWANSEADIDGEAEYTISACIYNPEDDEEGSWCEANGAWMICEVFPDEAPRDGVMLYDSIVDAFGQDVLAFEADHPER